MTVSLRFVSSRPLTGVELVQLDDLSLVESAPRLRTALRQRLGADAALLLAEPVLSRGNGSTPGRIDWYTERTGAVRPIGELAAAEADAVRARLADLSGRLVPLLGDPEVGPLTAAAFNLLSRGSLVAVDGEPLLVDWGLLPQGVSGDAAALARHHAETLGGLVPGIFTEPPVSRSAWAARFQPASAPGAPSGSPPQIRPTRFVAIPSARAPVVALAVTGGLLALSYIPGVLAFPEAPAAIPQEVRAVQAAWMEGLLRRRAALETAGDLDCSRLNQELPGLIPQRPGDVRISPDPRGPARATLAPPPRLPSAPGATAPPTPTGGTSDLVGAIERGTVLVLAGSAAGSGFFVSEELLVTNRHVVEGGGPLLVAGRHVGVLQAVLVRAGGAGPLEDFALLRVPRQSGVRPMALAAPGRPLTPVVAAGFPGLHLATDPIFQRLREGDGEASRSLEPVFQTGVVNHLQPQAEGVTLVVHGAEIAPGNSGGPLVDYCGRVMGVNTFGRTDDRLPITARYALGTDGLTAFLRAAGVDAPVDTGPCALEAPSPAVAEATPPRAAPLPAPAAAQADATPHPEPTPRPQDRSASPARAPSR